MKRLFLLMLYGVVSSVLALLPLKACQWICGGSPAEVITAHFSGGLREWVQWGVVVLYVAWGGGAFLFSMLMIVAVPAWKRALTLDPAAMPARVQPHGRRCLVIDSLYPAIGWCFVIAGIFTECLCALLEPRNVAMHVGSAMEFGFGLYTALASRCLLLFDEIGIRWVPGMGRAFDFEWTDVKAVTWNRRQAAWRVSLTNGRRFPLSDEMHGAQEFLTLLSARTGLTIPDKSKRL
jgi:hypothetical protein